MKTRSYLLLCAAICAAGIVAAAPPGSIVAWGGALDPGNSPLPAITNPPPGADFVQISGGQEQHAFALRTNGTIVGWGWVTSAISDAPAYSDWVLVKCGNQCTMGLRANGQLLGWGYNSSNQRTPPPGTYKTFALGYGDGAGLLTDGTIKTWGYDFNGSVNSPPSGNTFIALAAGNKHFLALRNNGTLVAWGSDDYNQVSGAPTTNDIVAVWSAPFASYALRENGQVVAWGDNGEGQTEVPAGEYVDITGGLYHGQGIRADGRVIAWGCKGYAYPYLPFNQGQLFAPTGTIYCKVAATSATCFALKCPPYPLGRVRKMQRLSGIGFAANPYAFGAVNLGNSVTGPRVSGSAEMTTAGLASNVAAGGMCDFSLVYNAGTTGSKTALFTLDDGAGGMEPLSFYVSGIGLPAPVAAVAVVSGLTGNGTADTPFDFGAIEVDTVVTGALRLSMSGATASNLYLLRTSGPANFRGSGLTPVLDAGAYDDFRVVYLAPSDAGDAHNAVFELGADAPMLPLNLQVRATPVLLLPLLLVLGLRLQG
ncbi:MAG: hypothetical protein NTV22_08440 [bacterium]|nr:hypothetical protein [bacterium]